jgi:hypothetical protein
MEAMYNLPKFEETNVEYKDGRTFLIALFPCGEPGWITYRHGQYEHRDIWEHHTAIVRRFRSAQRILRWGGRHFEITRRIANHMLYA